MVTYHQTHTISPALKGRVPLRPQFYEFYAVYTSRDRYLMFFEPCILIRKSELAESSVSIILNIGLITAVSPVNFILIRTVVYSTYSEASL